MEFLKFLFLAAFGLGAFHAQANPNVAREVGLIVERALSQPDLLQRHREGCIHPRSFNLGKVNQVLSQETTVSGVLADDPRFSQVLERYPQLFVVKGYFTTLRNESFHVLVRVRQLDCNARDAEFKVSVFLGYQELYTSKMSVVLP